jgi:outer membrane lipoprotein SlyB
MKRNWITMTMAEVFSVFRVVFKPNISRVWQVLIGFGLRTGRKTQLVKLRLVVVLMVLITVSCASGLGGSTYSRDEVRKVQTVEKGEVIMIREVQIEGTKSPFGAIAGGVMGYALGSAIGGGAGKTIAKAGGAVGGALAGAAAEEGLTRQKGQEITVKLDSGEVVAIVQGIEKNDTFDEGDRVQVLRRPDGTARVIQ